MFGGELIAQATEGLANGDGSIRDQVVRAMLHLRRLKYIAWRYTPVPNVDPPEPPLEFIDDSFLQRVQEIHVTGAGHGAHAARRRAGTHVSIVNSSVGQLALGDIRNLDILVLLDAIEQSLDGLDASEKEKLEARTTIQQMREAGANVASSAAGSVLAAALRQALGF